MRRCRCAVVWLSGCPVVRLHAAMAMTAYIASFPSPPHPAIRSPAIRTPHMPVPRHLDAYLTTNDERIRAELFGLLAVPGVSARSEHDADPRRCAQWIAGSLRTAGLAATVHETAGHPVVVGEYRAARE